MWQPAIVDVEVRIENRLALCAEEGRLGPDPQARLHLLGVGEKTRLQIAHDLGELTPLQGAERPASLPQRRLTAPIPKP